MVTEIRDIECVITIAILTNKTDHRLNISLKEYGIEMTVSELLEEAKKWFEETMENI